MMTHPKVSVIIPFFQKNSGILEKAAWSVLRQKSVDNYEIIVIDDSSPVSARQELRHLLQTHGNHIRIIEQKNMGPAAARNKGLDSVSPDTKYIAFLDSDDEWTEDHLSNALFALGKGYGFYCANFIRDGWDSDFSKKYTVFNYDDHLLIDKNRNIYKLGKDAFDALLETNFVGTSTVVCAYEEIRRLRFNERLFGVEDRLFWLHIAKMTDRFVFSLNVECHYGRGVNICDGCGWGSVGAIGFINQDTGLKKAIQKEFQLSPQQRSVVQKQLKKCRLEFAAALAHNILHPAAFDPRIILAQAEMDPMTILTLLPNLIRICAIKFRLKKGVGI